jgi:hypothetical protein
MGSTARPHLHFVPRTSPSIMLVQNLRTRRRVENFVTSAAPVVYLGWTSRYSKHQSDIPRNRVFTFRTDHVVLAVMATSTSPRFWSFAGRRLFRHEITHSTKIDCSMNVEPPRVSRTVAQTVYNPGSEGGNHNVE